MLNILALFYDPASDPIKEFFLIVYQVVSFIYWIIKMIGGGVCYDFFLLIFIRLSDLDILGFSCNKSIFINLQVGEECTTLITLGSVLALCNGLFYFTINNKTFLHSLMYAEVCYVGIILKLIDSSSFNGMFDGQIYALIMVTLAAAESALGLGVTIALFRLYKGVELNLVSIIKA
jgi:NADH-quinone oxidoreductase subunit K